MILHFKNIFNPQVEIDNVQNKIKIIEEVSITICYIIMIIKNE